MAEDRKFPEVLYAQIVPYQNRINGYETMNDLDSDKIVAEYKLVRVGKLNRTTEVDWKPEGIYLVRSE